MNHVNGLLLSQVCAINEIANHGGKRIEVKIGIDPVYAIVRRYHG